MDSGTGIDYKIHCNALDTNGTIMKYFWNESGAGLTNADSTDKDTLNRRVMALEVNKGWDMWIYARDDDGHLRGGRFVVFADSAPVAPTFFQNGTSGDSVVLKWEKKLDSKDGMQTRAQIVTCFGSGCTPSDSLYASDSWPTLSELEAKWPTENIGGIICNVVKFKATQSGAGRWRVILKDARETKTVAPGVDPATFVAP